MKLTASLELSNEYIVATCLELGITSQGSNMEEALSNLQEATELYLEEIHDQNFTQSLINKKLFITSFVAHA